MRQPYKIEIFDRAMEYKSMSVIPEPTIQFDYLTLEQTAIACPVINAEKGDLVHVTDSMGRTVYQGLIADLEICDKMLDLSVSPLLSLLDVSVTYDRVDLQNGALEDFIAGIIADKYIVNPDTLERIPGLSVTVTSATTNTALNIKSNVHELWDIITKAFSMYGVLVTAEFLPQTKSIRVTVGAVQTQSVTVEAGLDNCLERNFVIGDNYGSLNKMHFINKIDESEQITYYLHPDGTVDTTNTNRIWPVFASIEYAENDEDFWAEAESRAKEELTPQQHDNLIELTYLRDDRLLDAENMQIGQIATIMNDGEVYNSILTGYEQTETTVKLVFGIVRVDLTKKMILERRQQKAEDGNRDAVVPVTRTINGESLNGDVALNYVHVGAAAATHNHDASALDSGVLGVPRGGSGRSTLTSGYFLRGNGTSAVTMSTPAESRNAMGLGNTTGALGVPYGGSGVTNVPHDYILVGRDSSAMMPLSWWGVKEYLLPELNALGTQYEAEGNAQAMTAQSWILISNLSLTIPAGTYVISAHCSFNAANTGIATIRFNYSTATRQTAYVSSSGYVSSASMTDMVTFTAAQTIRIEVWPSMATTVCSTPSRIRALRIK